MFFVNKKAKRSVSDCSFLITKNIQILHSNRLSAPPIFLLILAIPFWVTGNILRHAIVTARQDSCYFYAKKKEQKQWMIKIFWGVPPTNECLWCHSSISGRSVALAVSACTMCNLDVGTTILYSIKIWKSTIWKILVTDWTRN